MASTASLGQQRDWLRRFANLLESFGTWRLSQPRRLRVDILEAERNYRQERIMRCQQCEKPATFHITELTDMEPQELHLCEDHAREYLSHAETPEFESPQLANQLAAQLKVGQTTEELSRLDKQACPVCGITFYEFRSQGRLGCPHDYECFADELEPLMVNIHGDTEHKGKSPKRQPRGTEHATEMIRIRRQMKEAVENEKYELASELRDKLKKLQEG